MKYILSIILLLGLMNIGSAQPYYGDNYLVNKAQQSILERAKRENKDVVLFFHSDWCGWCKKMEKETLNDVEVKKKLSNYLFYRVDVDKYKKLIKEYRVGSVPAYILISKEGKIIRRGTGYLTPEEFLRFLRFSEPPEKSGKILKVGLTRGAERL